MNGLVSIDYNEYVNPKNLMKLLKMKCKDVKTCGI